MLPENIDGYRRTAVKSRHFSVVKTRAEEYEDRGYKTRIELMGGYHHLYVKKDQEVRREDYGRQHEQ